MTARKQSAIVGLRVRMREPLRKKLEVAAKKRGVSLNAELVHRLEESFLSEGVLERIDRRDAETRSALREAAVNIFREASGKVGLSSEWSSRVGSTGKESEREGQHHSTGQSKLAHQVRRRP